MDPTKEMLKSESSHNRYAGMAGLLILAFTSMACASVIGPNVLNSTSSDERIETRSAIQADEIEVYWLDGQSRVPQGVIFRSPSERSFEDRLQLEAGFPSSEQPHVWTGVYLVRFANSFDQKTLVDAIKEKAAASGANALFLNIEGNVARAKAANLSRQSPDVEIRPASESLERLGAIEDYNVSQREVVSLDDTGRLIIDGQRGSCYFLVFALEEDAMLNSNARQSFRFQYHTEDRTIGTTPARPQFEELNDDNTLSPRSRAGHLRVGCPQTSASIEVEIFTGSDEHRSYRLGDGELTVEVLRADVSEAELEERAQAFQQRLIEICDRCAGHLSQCPDQAPGSCEEYETCISRSHGDVDICMER